MEDSKKIEQENNPFKFTLGDGDGNTSPAADENTQLEATEQEVTDEQEVPVNQTAAENDSENEEPVQQEENTTPDNQEIVNEEQVNDSGEEPRREEGESAKEAGDEVQQDVSQNKTPEEEKAPEVESEPEKVETPSRKSEQHTSKNTHKLNIFQKVRDGISTVGRNITGAVKSNPVKLIGSIAVLGIAGLAISTFFPAAFALILKVAIPAMLVCSIPASIAQAMKGDKKGSNTASWSTRVDKEPVQENGNVKLRTKEHENVHEDVKDTQNESGREKTDNEKDTVAKQGNTKDVINESPAQGEVKVEESTDKENAPENADKAPSQDEDALPDITKLDDKTALKVIEETAQVFMEKHKGEPEAARVVLADDVSELNKLGSRYSGLKNGHIEVDFNDLTDTQKILANSYVNHIASLAEAREKRKAADKPYDIIDGHIENLSSILLTFTQVAEKVQNEERAQDASQKADIDKIKNAVNEAKKDISKKDDNVEEKERKSEGR